MLRFSSHFDFSSPPHFNLHYALLLIVLYFVVGVSLVIMVFRVVLKLFFRAQCVGAPQLLLQIFLKPSTSNISLKIFNKFFLLYFLQTSPYFLEISFRFNHISQTIVVLSSLYFFQASFKSSLFPLILKQFFLKFPVNFLYSSLGFH